MNQWKLWNTYMPKISPYYAVKCNPDRSLLSWLISAGSKFDCASSTEMMMVNNLIHDKSQLSKSIVFANPCKTENDISTGKLFGINWVVADSVEELLKMKSHSYKPSIILRICVDDSSSSSPFNVKFGLSLNKVREFGYVVKTLGLDLIGLSFHVGSGCKDNSAFGNAVSTAHSIWKMLEFEKCVGEMKVLDIGGGFSHKNCEFISQAFSVTETIDKLKNNSYTMTHSTTNNSSRGIRDTTVIIAEPGRFFAAPTHDLYVKVIGKKPMTSSSGLDCWRYTLDESIYGQFSCIPFDHANPKFMRICVDENDRSRPSTPAIFFGRTCDSLDWIATSKSTEELEVGDWLYVPDMGAYTTSTSTEFNGFPKPPVVQIDYRPDNLSMSECSNMQFPLASMLKIENIEKELQ